jgi:hypothetical protein
LRRLVVETQLWFQLVAAARSDGSGVTHGRPLSRTTGRARPRVEGAAARRTRAERGAIVRAGVARLQLVASEPIGRLRVGTVHVPSSALALRRAVADRLPARRQSAAHRFAERAAASASAFGAAAARTAYGRREQPEACCSHDHQPKPSRPLISSHPQL